MFFVINRKKIGSYLVSLGTVLMLFVASISITNNNKTLATSGNIVNMQEKNVTIGINCIENVENIDSIVKFLSKEKIKVTFYITKDFQESNKEQINNIIENGNKVEEQVNKESNVINCDSIEIAQIKNRINATDSNFITIVIKNSKDTINKINSIIYSAKSMGYTIENL
jgi:hypothetical protein